MTRILLGLVVAVAYWLGLSGFVGWVANRLPDSWLERVAARWPRAPFEEGGGWYRKRLVIERWKDRLPEAGGFAGGRSKRHLIAREQVEVLYVETMRAELVHLVLLVTEWVPALWLPGTWASVALIYALGANLPFLAVQRYNRARIDRLRHARSLRAKER